MKKNEDYITLGQFLKLQDYVQSGGEAKHRINEFEIFVNGETDNRRGRKLYVGDEVQINGDHYIIESQDEDK
ncbi:MAG TPA: RNA-binding S4 domain-containing protein [Erysipelothrix sp.]